MRDNEVIEMAMKAGKLLLENGSEIFRIEDTIRCITDYYQVENTSAFVLSNGIFITAMNQETVYAKVSHIPVSGAHLDTVARINQFSREIAEGKYTLDEAKVELDRIEKMNHYSQLIYILASGIGSGAFCYLFGGTLIDSFVAFIAGAWLYLVILNITIQLSKIVSNVLGGMFVTVICMTFYRFGIGVYSNYMIIGSIMPLIPGVAFITSIREIAGGDYISGIVRLLDTLVAFLCIAIGVGFGMNIVNFVARGLGG